LKIIQLVQKPQLRGAEIFASQLSNHLQKSGVDVHLIFVFKGTSELPFNGKISYFKRPLSKRFWDFKAWKNLANIIKNEQPDLIQANAGDTLKFAIFSKLIYKWDVPIIFRNANKMGDFIDTKPKYLLNSFFVKKIDRVVSVSKLCELDFVKTFAYPSNNITTIPIGVEEVEIPTSPPNDLQSIYCQYKVLVNIGSLVPEKNHQALIRIFDSVAKSNPEVFLVIIGDGRLRAELEDQVSSLACKNRVLFTGYRNDVLQILKHASAFLMPSLIEGLPGVILEAMYCYTPVIANNVGGISEVVNHKTGWLIDEGDELAFALAVDEVLSDKKLVENKVNQASQLVSDEYMNSQIASKFKQVYEQVLIRKK
jgi:glycosyltransferase involved in cell wall biosynthesis